MKQVLVLFNAIGGTAGQYDQVWEDLRAAGQEHPRGLISHAGAAKPDGDWVVADVWESKEAFAEFSKILMPIISKNNLTPKDGPMILPAHYVYIGHSEHEPA